MRPARLLLVSAAASLLALTTSASSALASESGTDQAEEGPIEVRVETDADGKTTKVITVAADEAEEQADAKAKEAPEAGTTTKVIEIVDGGESVVIVETTDDDDEHDDEHDDIVEETIETHERTPELKWLGLQGSLVLSPTGATGRVSSSDGRLRSNQFKACADPDGTTACGYIKGMDFKVQMFETRGAWTYPRFVGYFRTGFEQGRVRFSPGEAGFAEGQATRLDYTSVPLFLGGNAYLFDEFPVRPYAGLGFGFDVLRLDYRRAQQARTVDASARIGFELHAGLEVRISNYVSLNAEVMQLWSARRKMEDLPDYSNTGMSVLAGVTLGIPVRLGQRGEHETVRKVRRVHHHD